MLYHFFKGFFLNIKSSLDNLLGYAYLPIDMRLKWVGGQTLRKLLMKTENVKVVTFWLMSFILCSNVLFILNDVGDMR